MYALRGAGWIKLPLKMEHGALEPMFDIFPGSVNRGFQALVQDVETSRA